MCGRFNLHTNLRDWAAVFAVVRGIEAEWQPSYNIAPTQKVLCIRASDERDVSNTHMVSVTRTLIREKDMKWLCGCLALSLLLAASAGADETKVCVELRRTERQAANGLTPATVPGTGKIIYLYPLAEVANADILSATVGQSEDGRQFLVDFVLTEPGALKMAKLTSENIDKPLAILVDGKVVAAPTILTKLGSKGVIAGNFTRDEAQRIADGLNVKPVK